MEGSEEAKVLGGPLGTIGLDKLISNISGHALAGVKKAVELDENATDSQK